MTNLLRKTRAMNMAGQTYGRLTALSRAGKTPNGQAKWLCVCECGNTAEVRGDYLRNGNTTSCGCAHTDAARASRRTHGRYAADYHKFGKLGRMWFAMTQRCYDENSRSYPDYGGRGIEVCDEWRTDTAGREACRNFVEWAAASGYEEGLQIDREDNSGGYEPDNCRFVTPSVNAINRRPKRWARKQSHESQRSQVAA